MPVANKTHSWRSGMSGPVCRACDVHADSPGASLPCPENPDVQRQERDRDVEERLSAVEHRLAALTAAGDALARAAYETLEGCDRCSYGAPCTARDHDELQRTFNGWREARREVVA